MAGLAPFDFVQCRESFDCSQDHEQAEWHVERDRRMYETRHTFATLMLDAGELPGWVQRMMGHETLQMIHERYYSYIKNYQRDDGKAFMENVYNALQGKPSHEEKKIVVAVEVK